MDLYGPILGLDDVAAAVEAFLQRWLPGYLAAVARRHDQALPAIADFDLAGAELPDLAERSYPAVVISSPGVEFDLGAGQLDGGWLVAVTVYVQASSRRAARTLVGRYVKAARAAVMQHRSLDGFASTTFAERESYAVVPDTALNGFRAGGTLLLRVWVAAVTDLHGGPDEPPADPAADPGDAPAVATVGVAVEPLEEP